MEQVLSRYDLGAVLSVEPVAGGIINSTYKVTAQRGVFVLQRLHPMFDSRVVDDYLVMREHLVRAGLYAPDLVTTSDGAHCVTDGAVWRLFPYVEHDEPLVDDALAFKAGRHLAQLHLALSSLAYEPAYKIPGFHQTRSIIDKLRDIPRTDVQKFARVAPEHEFILKHAPRFYLPPDERGSLIHGDPKLSNFLFLDGEVVAVIDFDTLMIASPLLDVGDALRSWSSKRDGGFSPGIFHAAVEGYRYGSGGRYSVEQCRAAMALITLELAARFLIDYFEESYFRWDRAAFSSAAEFNLFRCREQLTLYSQLMGSGEETGCVGGPPAVLCDHEGASSRSPSARPGLRPGA